MNWLPIRWARGRVRTKNNRFSSKVVLRNRRQRRRTGRYRACVRRETGFRDSGRNRPRMKRSISTGTSVIANSEEKPTASVFVQARGRNMRPSCASSRKTGRKETTMMTREKKIAGPTCLAASSRMGRLSVSGTGPESAD